MFEVILNYVGLNRHHRCHHVINSVCDMERLTVLIQTTPNLYKCAVLVLYANYVVVRAVWWVLVRRCDIYTLCNIGIYIDRCITRS